MNNWFCALLLFLSFLTGIAAVGLAYRLDRKYRLSYLSTYFYFQIFINVFGVYGLIGQVIARKILEQRSSSLPTTEVIGHFFSFLGLPFLMLAWYMFIRLCSEIREKSVSRTFTLAYFFVLTLIFLAFGTALILANVIPFDGEDYALLGSATSIFYLAFEILTLISALVPLFLRAREITDKKKRQAVRVFSVLCLSAYSLSLALYLLTPLTGRLAAVAVISFFIANLLPLLYWRTYLNRFYVAPALQRAGPEVMGRFIADYKISKREEEVIRHLCEGKTNKEIGQALFISLQTVKDHIYRIYQKTDVKNRVQLINLIQSYKVEEETSPNS
jgi:DNA-binding CsgD family transcriptional regulator